MPDQNLTKAQRRDAARAEALELRKAQERRERRNRTITFVVLGVLVVAVAVAVFFIMKANKDANSPKALSDVTMPATAQDDGGIPFGKDGVAGTTNAGAPTLDIYFDYLCPYCGNFEKTNSDDIDALREAGDVTVVMHPMNMLDSYSAGSHYSTRAANAFATAADKDPSHALALSEALFANQPEENTVGLKDDEIASLAKTAGVSEDAVSAFTDATFDDYIDALTEAETSKSDFTGTPTILINGKKWSGSWQTAGTLKKALQDAKG